MSHGFQPFHMIQLDDGSQVGLWGPLTLKSAFQPIFRFDDGKLVIAAFEGLIRPFQGDEAVPPPVFFRSVPPGERLQVEVLTRALHLLNAGLFLDPAMQVFVNFDPSVYVDREMARSALREMRRTLVEAHIDPSRVVCEVTEQKSASPDALQAFISILRGQGFRIAVDDYGAEDSDMDRVAALRPDIVKFDAQWIARLMESRPGIALLSVMVSTFSDRGCTIVFEGLEESWQLEIAEEVGAHMVQGYVLARPEIAPTSFAMPDAIRRVEERNGAAHAVVRPLAPATVPSAAMRSRIPPTRPFGRRSSS